MKEPLLHKASRQRHVRVHHPITTAILPKKHRAGPGGGHGE
ncbi:hypothetical protein SAMN05216478_2377, partial [Cutibacterium acnes]